MRSVGLVFVFGDTLLTWADYVSMIEDQDKYDKWSNNKFRGENRGICLMLATNSS